MGRRTEGRARAEGFAVLFSVGDLLSRIREVVADAGPSASAVHGTCRLTAASVPRFPWGVGYSAK